MRNQNFRTEDEGLEERVADLDEQLAIYDRLPLRFRQITDSLPMPINMEQVEAVIALYGEREAERLVIAACKENFPEWREEMIDLKPSRPLRRRL